MKELKIVTNSVYMLIYDDGYTPMLARSTEEFDKLILSFFSDCMPIIYPPGYLSKGKKLKFILTSEEVDDEIKDLFLKKLYAYLVECRELYETIGSLPNNYTFGDKEFCSAGKVIDIIKKYLAESTTHYQTLSNDNFELIDISNQMFVEKSIDDKLDYISRAIEYHLKCGKRYNKLEEMLVFKNDNISKFLKYIGSDFGKNMRNDIHPYRHGSKKAINDRTLTEEDKLLYLEIGIMIIRILENVEIAYKS